MTATQISGADRAKAETLLQGQRRVLEMVNRDDDLHQILDEICRVVESQADGMYCSVLLLDDEGKHLLHGGAPSLPPAYCKAIHGITIGNGVGSCGTAAFTGEPCIVESIATHANWAPFKALAHDEHGLAACWSVPVTGYDGKVLATFAIYHKVPKAPALKERKLIDFSKHLVSIAVNRHRELKQLES